MFANMGIGSLILIILLVVLLFGTKKLRNLGSDLGSAVKGFKKSMENEEQQDADFEQPNQRVSDKSSDPQAQKQSEVKDKS